jgi:EpsI family protein
VPVIGGVNAVRVVVSGLLQEHVGADSVRGHWHEVLGVAMVLLGLMLIVLLARVLGAERHRTEEKPTATAESVQRKLPIHRPAAIIVLGGALAATVGAQLLGAGAEEEIVASAPLEQVPLRIGRWKGTERPVPDEIRAMLTPDSIVHREYNDLGYEITVWMIYWSSRNMVKGYHHPDVCWRNRGFRQESRDLMPIAAGGGTVPITVREFARPTEERSNRQLILYWTQEGKRIWSEEDERRVQAAGDSHDWLGERLFRRDPVAQTGRLVVLVGTPVWDDGRAIRSQTLEFARELADEVYRLCPWAAPPTP